jgi:hypothetical protein
MKVQKTIFQDEMPCRAVHVQQCFAGKYITCFIYLSCLEMEYNMQTHWQVEGLWKGDGTKATARELLRGHAASLETREHTIMEDVFSVMSKLE